MYAVLAFASRFVLRPCVSAAAKVQSSLQGREGVDSCLTPKTQDWLPATGAGVTVSRGAPNMSTAASRANSLAEHLRRSCETIERAAADRALLEAMMAIADVMIDALKSGGKILIAGNGGSAADAQHIAGEFLSRLNFDRNPLPAIALTTDTSVLTAIGNDYGFEQVFERQVRGLGRAGDVFIGLSTSGRSENVLAALRAARELDLVTVGFTGGSGGDMHDLCDFICA